jgi:hypothetical protein
VGDRARLLSIFHAQPQDQRQRDIWLKRWIAQRGQRRLERRLNLLAQRIGLVVGDLRQVARCLGRKGSLGGQQFLHEHLQRAPRE